MKQNCPLRKILPDPSKPIEEQNLAVLMAMCIWGEARGEPWEGKLAVGWVIQNRVDRHSYFGKNHREVILKPYQFSCMNKGDKNRKKMLYPIKYSTLETWLECFVAGELVLTFKVPDLTHGATHYFADYIKPPKWAENMQFIKQIGHHRFYRE